MRAADDDADLVAAIERIEAQSLPLCNFPVDPQPFGERLAALLERADSPAEAVIAAVSPVEAMNDFIFRRLGIKASRDIHDPCNLLPSAVLARKEGYCVGIAAIYLALAGRLDLPVHTVAVPSHVYLRYDDGRGQIDIETMAMGGPTPEGDSIPGRNQAAAAGSRVTFPRDLDTGQFLAQMHNNLGVVHSERGDHAGAAAEYQEALALDPLLSAAWYNWGNDLLGTGEHREAIRKLDEALRIYPIDTWALNNRGRAWMALGKRSRARKDFEAALTIDPEFRPARRNLRTLDMKEAATAPR